MEEEENEEDEDEEEEEKEEEGSAEDEKNAVCVHGSGGSDVCESRVRLAPVVVSVASTGPGSGPQRSGVRSVAVSVGPRAG